MRVGKKKTTFVTDLAVATNGKVLRGVNKIRDDFVGPKSLWYPPKEVKLWLN